MTDDHRPTPDEAKTDNPDEPVEGAELPADVPMGDPSVGDEADEEEGNG